MLRARRSGGKNEEKRGRGPGGRSSLYSTKTRVCARIGPSIPSLHPWHPTQRLYRPPLHRTQLPHTMLQVSAHHTQRFRRGRKGREASERRARQRQRKIWSKWHCPAIAKCQVQIIRLVCPRGPGPFRQCSPVAPVVFPGKSIRRTKLPACTPARASQISAPLG